jgi:hypothetical protein
MSPSSSECRRASQIQAQQNDQTIEEGQTQNTSLAASDDEEEEEEPQLPAWMSITL